MLKENHPLDKDSFDCVFSGKSPIRRVYELKTLCSPMAVYPEIRFIVSAWAIGNSPVKRVEDFSLILQFYTDI